MLNGHIRLAPILINFSGRQFGFLKKEEVSQRRLKNKEARLETKKAYKMINTTS